MYKVKRFSKTINIPKVYSVIDKCFNDKRNEKLWNELKSILIKYDLSVTLLFSYDGNIRRFHKDQLIKVINNPEEYYSKNKDNLNEEWLYKDDNGDYIMMMFFFGDYNIMGPMGLAYYINTNTGKVLDEYWKPINEKEQKSRIIKLLENEIKSSEKFVKSTKDNELIEVYKKYIEIDKFELDYIKRNL